MSRRDPKFACVLLCLLGLPMAAQGEFAPAADGHADPQASLPARKAGRWEVTVQGHASPVTRGMRQPPQTVQQCTDAKAERIMLLAILPVQENCRATRVSRRSGQQGQGFDIDTVCSVHDRRVKAHMALRGDLRTVYSGSYSVEYPDAPQVKSGPVDFQGRWLGPCAPGQRVGEMVLPNGIKVNVLDDVLRAESHAH